MPCPSDLGQRPVLEGQPGTSACIAIMAFLLAHDDPANGDAEGQKALLEQEFGSVLERCTMTAETHVHCTPNCSVHHQLSDVEAAEAQCQALAGSLAA